MSKEGTEEGGVSENQQTEAASAKTIRRKIRDTGTSRRTKRVDLDEIGTVEVRSVTREELRAIQEQAGGNPQLPGSDFDPQTFEHLKVMHQTYGLDGEHVFDPDSEEHRQLLDDIPAVSGSWYQRLTDTIAWVDGDRTAAPGGTDQWWLNQLDDRCKQAREAIDEDDRFDDPELKEDVYDVVHDLHEQVKEAKEEVNENLIPL